MSFHYRTQAVLLVLGLSYIILCGGGGTNIPLPPPPIKNVGGGAHAPLAPTPPRFLRQYIYIYNLFV